MKIVIDTFKGQIPGVADDVLPVQNASQAVNAKLTKGDLQAWPQPLLTESLTETSLQTIIQYAENSNLNWVAFEEDVDHFKSPLTSEAYERVYYSGLSEPRVFANDLVSGTFDQTTDYYKLGVPEPDGNLGSVLSLTSTCTDPEDDQNNTTGWTATDAALVSEAGGVTGYRLKVTASAANGRAYDALSVTSGNQYVFRCYAGADSGDEYSIRLRYNTAGPDEYLSADVAGQGAGTWDYIEYAFTASVTDADFRIEVRAVSNTDVAYFDEVVLYEKDTDDNSPTIGSGYSTDSTYRAYTYIYVTKYGERGPPSETSSISDYGSGTVPIEDIWDYPPEDRQIDRIYLYRTSASAAGIATFRFVLEAEFFDDATAYSVGEYVIYCTKLYKCTSAHSAGVWDASDFTAGDDVTDANLSIVTLESQYWDPPPAGLTGLIILPNGVAAGFLANDIYLSEPYQVHAFPESYIVSIPQTVVGIGNFGNNIVVATDGNPYIISGETPEQVSVRELKGNFPCRSKRSIVSSRFGVQFVCREGMVRVNENGLIIDTLGLMNPSDWDDYFVNTIAGVVYSHKYFAFYEDGDTIHHGFYIDYEENNIVELDFEIYCGYISEDDGKLYIGANDEYDEDNPPASKPLCIKEWEGDEYNYLYYRFRSKQFVIPYEINFACARIIYDEDFYNTILQNIEDDAYLAGLNATIFAGDILGAVNDDVVNELPVHGDLLYDLSGASINPSIVFRVYSEGTLKFSKTVENNKIFKLNSGYKKKKYKFVIEGNIPIKRLDVATTAEEIMRG